jgi:FdhE protein
MAIDSGLKPDPSQIGGILAPPFARLPDPAKLFAVRAARLSALAAASDLGPYLAFLAGLVGVQHALAAGDGGAPLPAAPLPSLAVRERARAHAMPPLDRAAVGLDDVVAATLARFFTGAAAVAMPEAARAALARVGAADEATLALAVRDVLADALPMDALAEHVFVAAALQVHFARLAAGLDPKALVPVGDGVCPACGGPPAVSLVVGWREAEGARYCACALCGTHWNHVRIKCVACGSTKGIGYREIEGGPGTIRAETCEECGTYVKVLYHQKDASLEALADDVASLGLDLLVRDDGYRRGGFDPFLVGY